MARMILVRGLPGSGKTTFAKSHFPDAVHCEADDWLTGPNGYQFDPGRLTEAHMRCRDKAVAAVRAGKDAVVSNTFSRVWEMARYFGIGELVVYRMSGTYPNVHGVPEETVQRMRDRWEDFPGEINA